MTNPIEGIRGASATGAVGLANKEEGEALKRSIDKRMG